MQFIASIRVILFAALLVTSPLFAAEAAIVQFIWGSAFSLSPGGEKRQLEKGSGIEVGDIVVSEDARLQLRFSDGGLVSLAPHSQFRVNAYSYSGTPDGSERIEMELLKGGLRTISGLIGKAIKTAYEMKTAVATMGIRGTEYTVVYADGVTGTVSEGAIAVCNAGGCLDVLRGQSYQVMNLDTKPVLISKAAFLPPPPLEKVGKKIDVTQGGPSNNAGGWDGNSNKTDNEQRKYADEGARNQMTRGQAEIKASHPSLNKSAFATLFAPKSLSAVKGLGQENSSRSLRPIDSGGVLNGVSPGKMKLK